MADINMEKPGAPECASCIGYAYVPVQQLEAVYEPYRGLERGTMFPELDMPMDVYGYVCTEKGGGE